MNTYIWAILAVHEYNDTSEWVVACHTTKDAATLHVAWLTSAHEKNVRDAPGDEGIFGKRWRWWEAHPNPEDPSPRSIQSYGPGVVYRVQETVLKGKTSQ